MMNIKNNYFKILDKVKTINDKATLVAVSKTKPCEYIKMLYDYSHRDFGENHVQELVEKYNKLPKDIRWHFIGHLQTNKVKYIIDKVTTIQSVDSIKLAKVINEQALKKNISVDILIQINYCEDENKYGFKKDEFIDAIEEISKMPAISIKGIMMIPKINLTDKELNDLFAQFSMLKLDIERKKIDNVCIEFLSFGMSDDYEIALKNGSNMVRVGSAIFGGR